MVLEFGLMFLIFHKDNVLIRCTAKFLSATLNLRTRNGINGGKIFSIIEILPLIRFSFLIHTGLPNTREILYF
jgi:hypothetical protein